MARNLALACSVTLAVVLLAPTAAAWTLPPVPSGPARPLGAAWTTDLTPSAVPGDVGATLAASVGCAIGDVSADGTADLVVLVSDPASGVQTLQALAGPEFATVVWEKSSSLPQVLRCAPDLDLDGTLDPIVETLGETTGTASSGVADQAQRQVQQVLDGASGVVLIGRTATESATGVAGPAAAGAAGAAQEAASALLPAAAGAAAVLQTEVTTAMLPIPAGVPLPVDMLSATITQSAQLQVLDAAGAVVTTVSIDEAGVEVLAMAPLSLTGGLPDVAVLTRALGPVEEVATGIPELAMYASDGTLAWATELPAATGVPVLLPQAGDLDLDGVGDLIVSSVQQGVETAPAAAFTVLSGVDGQVLFDSGDAVAGIMAALPLGPLPDGAALLRVATGTAGSLALSALDGTGQVLWSVSVDGLAEPANAVLDAHTGDITGFTDLTGDAVPDIAVAVAGSAGLELQAINGLTGEVAWNLTLPGIDHVVPVVVQAAATAAGQAQAAAQLAQGTVADVQAGATSALLALGSQGQQATLMLIDAAAGKVQWAAKGIVPLGSTLTHLAVDLAGDLDGDGLQDLLVSATFAGPGSSDGFAVAQSNAGPADSVTAVSGDSGATLYTASAETNGPGLEFEETTAPASESTSSSGAERDGIPAPTPALLALAVLIGALLRRRR